MEKIEPLDDEIDLREIVRFLWMKKVFILIFVSTCVFLAGVFTKMLDKQYLSYATYHMISDDVASPIGLNRYSSLLGISSQSNVENIFSNLLDSYMFKEELAFRFKSYFDKEIQEAIKMGEIEDVPHDVNNFLISKMNLFNNFVLNKSKSDLYEISYFSVDPVFSRDVVQTSLDILDLFNQKLEISASKKLFMVIDSPRVSKTPFKPNLIINLAVSFIVSLFISCFYLLLFNSSSKNSLGK